MPRVHRQARQVRGLYASKPSRADRSPLARLIEIINEVKAENGKILVFLNTKRSVQEMTDWIRELPDKYEALCLHGDKRQEERDFALNEFRKVHLPSRTPHSKHAESTSFVLARAATRSSSPPTSRSADWTSRALRSSATSVRLARLESGSILTCSLRRRARLRRLLRSPVRLLPLAAEMRRLTRSMAASAAPLALVTRAAPSPFSPAAATAVRRLPIQSLCA